MVRRAALGAALACVAWLAASPRAEAQREEARQLWLEGRALTEAGDYEAALDRFERSFDLVERASTALSVATLAVELGRGERALAALDDLERLADPTADAELLASGRTVRARAEALVEAARPPPEDPSPPIAPPLEEPAPRATDPEPSGGVEPFLGPIVLGALAAVSLGLDIGAFVAREDRVAERDALCPNAFCPDDATADRARALHDDASTFTAMANVAGIAAGVLAAAAATWLVIALTTSSEPEASQAYLRLGPGHVSVAGQLP